jgi:hypothetical protein
MTYITNNEIAPRFTSDLAIRMITVEDKGTVDMAAPALYHNASKVLFMPQMVPLNAP